MEGGWIIGLIITLVVLNIIVWVWFWIARSNLHTCENTEKVLCPSYYCRDASNYCTDPNNNRQPSPNSAFRFRSSGEVQCQSYTVTPTLTDVPHGCGPGPGYLFPCV